jgi:hypothetical protein
MATRIVGTHKLAESPYQALAAVVTNRIWRLINVNNAFGEVSI